jgi:hypothetical protein
MKAVEHMTKRRFRRDAGIALGPILFIIAILAILAAAIAAGSGSFNASTASEGNKTKASAIIQIGDNLKVGMDRLTMENSIAPTTWVISAGNTQNSTDLFSPIGGGISPPSIAMANNPASDAWLFPQGAIPGLGTYFTTAANTLQLAALRVSQGVCQEINNRANGLNSVPTNADLGNFNVPYTASTAALTMNGAWPAALNGKPIGCVGNTNGGSAGYYFYEVLYVQ